MIFRRFFCFSIALFLSGFSLFAAPSEQNGPVAPVNALCDSLLAAMKRGASLDYSGRIALLAPEIQRDFDLALMTRLVVGPPWRNFSSADQENLAKAFSDYSIATYAQRFKSYSGERFEVDPTPTVLPRGDSIVHTKLFTGGSDSVQLDYLLRKKEARWRIIDVFLSGTISELAARRSEYSTVLRQGGAPALIELLRKKVTELGN